MRITAYADQKRYTLLSKSFVLFPILVSVGAVYCDGGIWRSGSFGEGITSSNVLVVKSHDIGRVWTKQSIKDPDWVSLLLIF